MINSFKSEADSAQIMRVMISIASEDKFSIFYSIGQNIRGVTKKGKEFFKLDTSHTEAITSLHVAN